MKERALIKDVLEMSVQDIGSRADTDLRTYCPFDFIVYFSSNSQEIFYFSSPKEERNILRLVCSRSKEKLEIQCYGLPFKYFCFKDLKRVVIRRPGFNIHYVLI